MTVLLIVFLFKKEEEIKPLTRPSGHFVLDLLVTQRAYGDLDTARAAHTLVFTRVQRDVRLGGTADSTGQPHPFQGLLQMATPTSL